MFSLKFTSLSVYLYKKKYTNGIYGQTPLLSFNPASSMNCVFIKTFIHSPSARLLCSIDNILMPKCKLKTMKMKNLKLEK